MPEGAAGVAGGAGAVAELACLVVAPAVGDAVADRTGRTESGTQPYLLVGGRLRARSAARVTTAALPIGQVDGRQATARSTGVPELDRVLGGGFIRAARRPAGPSTGPGTGPGTGIDAARPAA